MAVVDHIYVEDDVRDHVRVTRILKQFPYATVTPCRRYGEVFNRNQQNFRHQKQRPALILARKHKGYVLPTPATYGIGSAENYYFSHMLNCLYDCRYCFLQGMFRSANYLLFVNYDDFIAEIERQINMSNDSPYFFSGYDCDSLALDRMTEFTSSFLPTFAKHPRATLELRTKSVNVNGLLKQPALENVIVAFSLSPQGIADSLEHGAPSVGSRLKAIKRLQDQRWRVGLRFDPIIMVDDFRSIYGKFFSDVFATLDEELIHSVTLGSFRMPKMFFERVQRLYPQESLFHKMWIDRSAIARYTPRLEDAMISFCKEAICHYVPKHKLFLMDQEPSTN